MSKINKLDVNARKSGPGRRLGPPPKGAENAGLEQALAEAGGIRALAHQIGIPARTLTNARAYGPSMRIVLALFERARIKLTKLLGHSVKCPHCTKEI